MIESSVRDAKRMMKECVQIYLQKDPSGSYRLPRSKQRPIYLEGPAGVGKTEMVKQVAQELGIGFVSYSMTHHSRQSAIGLPAIVEKELGGEVYKATEYTMSEIVESVWNAKREGAQEGILFADEINCVSETLSAAMLQFLQNKTFGPHIIPEGWVIVAAGNPPAYNKSVKIFDAVTRDRLRVIHVRPDRDSWLEYARHKGMHPIVIQYVTDHPKDFYVFDGVKSREEIVTARAWEDLSNALKAYEANGFLIDEAMVASFIQREVTARSFLQYYRVSRELITSEEIAAVLAGRVPEKLAGRMKELDLVKRWAIVMCIYQALQGRTEDMLARVRLQDRLYEDIRAREASAAEKKAFRESVESLQAEIDRISDGIDALFAFTGGLEGGERETGILTNLFLENEVFMEAAQFCRMGSLLSAYDAASEQKEQVKKDIRRWMKAC